MTEIDGRTPEQVFSDTLKSIRSLTVDQFQTRVAEAEASVRSVIGLKPDINNYRVHMLSRFGAIERMMFALLIVLFMFSVVHVMSWTRTEALHSYSVIEKTVNAADKDVGIVLSQSLYVILQQISVLFVTEIGMVALSIYHMYRSWKNGAPPAPKFGWAWVIKFPIWLVSRYFFMILAGLIGISVLNANLNSGFNSFVSALVPVITISLSEMFAQLFAANYTDRQQQELEYKAAAAVWNGYNNNPKTHAQYNQFLSGHIQDWYRKNQTYKAIEFTPQLLQYLAAREKAIHARAFNDEYLVEQLAGEINRPFLSQDKPQELPSPTPPQPSSPAS